MGCLPHIESIPSLSIATPVQSRMDGVDYLHLLRTWWIEVSPIMCSNPLALQNASDPTRINKDHQIIQLPFRSILIEG